MGKALVLYKRETEDAGAVHSYSAEARPPNNAMGFPIIKSRPFGSPLPEGVIYYEWLTLWQAEQLAKALDADLVVI